MSASPAVARAASYSCPISPGSKTPNAAATTLPSGSPSTHPARPDVSLQEIEAERGIGIVGGLAPVADRRDGLDGVAQPPGRRLPARRARLGSTGVSQLEEGLAYLRIVHGAHYPPGRAGGIGARTGAPGNAVVLRYSRARAFPTVCPRAETGPGCTRGERGSNGGQGSDQSHHRPGGPREGDRGVPGRGRRRRSRAADPDVPGQGGRPAGAGGGGHRGRLRGLPAAARPARPGIEKAGGRFMVCPVCFNAKRAQTRATWSPAPNWPAQLQTVGMDRAGGRPPGRDPPYSNGDGRGPEIHRDATAPGRATGLSLSPAPPGCRTSRGG